MVADFSRQAGHSTDDWVRANSYATAEIAFGFGVLLGSILASQVRS
jgi:ElaB/YqjD/DUF883 family membrane-anchored ribosome-binding protein